MKLEPPAGLATLVTIVALVLFAVGEISQRTYAPFNPPDTLTIPFPLEHRDYTVDIPFVMSATPAPQYSSHCLIRRQGTPGYDPRCSWGLYLVDQSREDRIRLLLHEGAGANHHQLTIRYGDLPPVTTDAITTTDTPWQSSTMPWLWANDKVRMLLTYEIIFATFGLFVLWRGKEAAIWLGFFCLCLAPFFLNFYGALSPDRMLEAWTAGALLRRLADFSLFAMALMLVAPFLNRRLAQTLVTIAVAISILALLCALLPRFQAIERGYVDGWLDVVRRPALGVIEILLLGVMPIALLLVGVFKAQEPERQRLAIVAGVIALGLIGPVIDGAINGFDHFGELWATALIIPVGFTYAIPRYHVVDVGFVVNRIIVYALLIGTVSAGIALAEVFVTTAAHDLTNPAKWPTFLEDFKRALPGEVPIGFVIVLSLRWVHLKLEHFVNHVLFRKRHEALKKLSQFIEEIPFAHTRDGLLDRAVDEIHTALATRGVAIYEKTANGYHCVKHIGAFTAEVQDDDPAIWFLRSERTHIRLADMHTKLGDAGIAFAMCLRGNLEGAVVCHARRNEQYEGDYAPDETEAMMELSTRLAEQLFALRAEDLLNFVNAVASGTLQGDVLRRKATELGSSNGVSPTRVSPN